MKLFLEKMKLLLSNFVSAKPKKTNMKKIIITFILYFLTIGVGYANTTYNSHGEIYVKKESTSSKGRGARSRIYQLISWDICAQEIQFSNIPDTCDYVIITSIESNMTFYFFPENEVLIIPLLPQGEYMLTIVADGFMASGCFIIN